MRYKEDDLQMAVANYLDFTGLLWMHPANERRTSPQAGARLKRKGVKSGVPDILVFNNNWLYKGLAIELKIKPNKLSVNQKQWIKDLEKEGWLCVVCYDLDEAIRIINEYKEHSINK